MERILEDVNPCFDFEIVPLLQKDSIELTEDDRNKIYEICISTDYNKIIITHGTDTMIETATRLADIKDKTIILTGAMRPERFTNSDADFNFGVAVGAINTAPPGIYIAMNGIAYPYNKVKRNPST